MDTVVKPRYDIERVSRAMQQGLQSLAMTIDNTLI
ncbi:MAG TPA: hypothetical protein LFW20_02840 [Rickettsia endosymbiont of Omalisus fontisbellaquei]|nr:hypothetical protein [Rickettsia endosymbiont of Omalisus fontisbellaquei]